MEDVHEEDRYGQYRFEFIHAPKPVRDDGRSAALYGSLAILPS